MHIPNKNKSIRYVLTTIVHAIPAIHFLNSPTHGDGAQNSMLSMRLLIFVETFVRNCPNCVSAHGVYNCKLPSNNSVDVDKIIVLSLSQ